MLRYVTPYMAEAFTSFYLELINCLETCSFEPGPGKCSMLGTEALRTPCPVIHFNVFIEALRNMIAKSPPVVSVSYHVSIL
jgi:hypothetical protein